MKGKTYKMILTRLGNKRQLALDIYKYFPVHKMRIDLFFGAGGSFFYMPKAQYNIVEDIFEKAYWDESKKNPSTYYKRIENLGPGDYFVQRTEIFARLFEQYIAHKLKELNIRNNFLTKTKYTRVVYMTPAEFKKVLPYFDKLLVQMRKVF